MYDLDDELSFGKYKGKTVEEVLEEDPHYLKWAMENVASFVVDNALHDEIISACRRRK